MKRKTIDPRSRLIAVTCSCGRQFEYRRVFGSARTLCPECTIDRQGQETIRISKEKRGRMAALPKVWTSDERTSYVSAEGHLNKALVQMSKLSPGQRSELIMRLMSALGGDGQSRSLPPRIP